ncbi:anoctamin-9 isoform X2 [Mauremys mutica]|uniref:anoctamin-9 isoform X2 n=1 Tax=Mauremys mutica TaxID=74926 RepID=UPI001D16AB78|nr:anoctamin-9 isoform X2 [Mauremys mutica]
MELQDEIELRKNCSRKSEETKPLVPLQDEIERSEKSSQKSEETKPLVPDFILVCDKHESDVAKREEFLNKLKKKNFTIKTRDIKDKKLFYGVRAPSEIFQNYQCPLKNSDSGLQNHQTKKYVPITTRIRIVNFILQNPKISPEDSRAAASAAPVGSEREQQQSSDASTIQPAPVGSEREQQQSSDASTIQPAPVGSEREQQQSSDASTIQPDSRAAASAAPVGSERKQQQGSDASSTQPETLQKLIKAKVFEAAFPLHEQEGTIKNLKENWAQWRKILKQQPIKDIRSYFGEKVALYFAWLGWYTRMLFPAAVLGLLVFLYGIFHFDSSQVSKEICEANTTIMCPLCDQKCPFWQLSDTCTYAKVTHLFDNEGTILFAVLMALWATVFLELWKRKRAEVVSGWELYGWDEDEEELALQLINDPKYTLKLYQHSYIRSTILLLLVLLMITVLIGLAHAFVIYRVVATVLFTKSNFEFIREHASTVAVATGAVLHYITIIVMTKVNRRVALFLCELEKPRTFSERENIFTVKIFTFQFFTYFSSLIYIAFFLGRINGRPGNYVRVAGEWRLEECHPSGCITDLFIQMAIIMTLKQTLNNLEEYLIPWLRLRFRKLLANPKDKNEVDMEKGPEEQWLKNYQLNKVNVFSLFDEFLEMMIQYSFTTIFVAAFPLAPLMAFINNLFEIRLDAIKMVQLQRRIVPRKANDIGIWLQVLEAIGILAVIGNGLVIAITSDFIPRQVYKYTYSPCVLQNHTDINCLTGYINHSLSVFRVQDFEWQMKLPEKLPDFLRSEITECRYRDYRNSDDYNYSAQFWHVFAARLAFLILFEHVALCIKLIAAWYVPDVPQSVKNKHLQKKLENLTGVPGK